MLTEHVADRTRGRIVTSEDGPVYFNQPRGGLRDGRAPLVFGGGDDRPLGEPALAPALRALCTGCCSSCATRSSPSCAGRPPSAEWIGPMGFTPDQLPLIGLLRPGVVVAAGFNGYGGSYTTAAGEAAAALALTGEAPPWLDAEVFSPTPLHTRVSSSSRARRTDCSLSFTSRTQSSGRSPTAAANAANASSSIVCACAPGRLPGSCVEKCTS